MLLRFVIFTSIVFGFAAPVRADEALAKRIDDMVVSAAKGKPLSPRADDAEFLRRAYLDFAGRIPSASETRKFLAEKADDRRVKLIDQLLASPAYAVRMRELFDVMLMERLGDHPEWTKYLEESFAKN